MSELKPDIQRQATPTIRGFAYQCYQTIRAWLQCQPDEELRCEFAEDFDLVRRDLAGQVTEVELNQVKHEKQTVTLNSGSVIDLLNNFFRHKSRNPAVKLIIRLCSIADRGMESRVVWPCARCGLDLWDQLRTRTLNPEDQVTAIEALRSYLQGRKGLSSEVKAFLETADHTAFFSELVDRVFWDTGQLSYGDIQRDICALLSRREKPISDPLESEQIINRLWRKVMDLLASDSNRTLTRADLESTLLEDTTAKVDRDLFKQMASKIDQTSMVVTNMLAAMPSKVGGDKNSIQVSFEGLTLNEELPPCQLFVVDELK